MTVESRANLKKFRLRQATKPSWRFHALNRGLGQFFSLWAELQRSEFAAEPMFDARFIDSLLTRFGDGSEVLCVWSPHDRPEGMCILRPRRHGHWSTFKPAQAQLGTMMMREDAPIASLLAALPGVAVALDLVAVDPRLTACTLLSGGNVRRAEALTMNVSLSGDYSAWLTARASKLRTNLKRWERRCSDTAIDVQYRCIDAADTIGEAVWRFADLESSGWKAHEGTSVSRTNDQGIFYRSALEKMAEDRCAEVHELWFGETLAASRLVITSSESVVFLKTTYNETLAAFAPGRLLLANTLRTCFLRHRGKTVEFHTDATADQLAWCTEWRHMFSLTVYRSFGISLVAQVARCALRWGRPAARSPSDTTVRAFDPLTELPASLSALFSSGWKSHEQPHDVSTLLEAARRAATSAQVRVFALQRGGAWAAALWLAVDNDAPGVCRALSVGDRSLFEPPIAPWVKSEDFVPVWQCVLREWPAVHEIRLEPMDPMSPTFAMLRAAIEDLAWFPVQRHNHHNFLGTPTHADPGFGRCSDGPSVSRHQTLLAFDPRRVNGLSALVRTIWRQFGSRSRSADTAPASLNRSA